MGVLIVTAAISLMGSRGKQALRSAGESSFGRLAVLTAATAFVTLVLGSYISGTEASLACEGWPLCNGSLTPGGSSAEGLHWLHRVVAGLLGLLMLGTAYLAFEEGRPRLLTGTMLAASGLYITQAVVGAANIWTELAAGVVVAHLSLAALLWCIMVAVSALAWYLPGRSTSEQAQRAAARAGEASEWAR
jgi:heme A synthase